jgi:hypothetical protein
MERDWTELNSTGCFVLFIGFLFICVCAMSIYLVAALELAIHALATLPVWLPAVPLVVISMVYVERPGPRSGQFKGQATTGKDVETILRSLEGMF